jgi:hypothetical protein
MAPTLDQITMVKQLLAGAKLSVAVEPEGRLVQTSSPFVDGNRVTLVDVDIDKAAADPDLAAKLKAASDPASEGRGQQHSRNQRSRSTEVTIDSRGPKGPRTRSYACAIVHTRSSK